MVLTHNSGIAAVCSPAGVEPDVDILEAANDELFDYIRKNRQLLIDQPQRKLLDIGCGDEGSKFVNRYAQEFPGTEVVYLDNFVQFLREGTFPRKVLADATHLPFPDSAFDLAYAGHIIANGVIKNHWFCKNENYDLTQEAHRVLRPGGTFLFTYCCGDDLQTLLNLHEIGFGDIRNLQRVIWCGMPHETYSVVK